MPGWGSDRERKKIAREIRKRMARREAWRKQISGFQARCDAGGLIKLMATMHAEDDVSPALLLEAGRAAASCGPQAQEEAILAMQTWNGLFNGAIASGRKISPVEQYLRQAGGLTIALCGPTSWSTLREYWEPDDPGLLFSLGYLYALASFEVSCEEVRSEATSLLDAFPTQALRGVDHPLDRCQLLKQYVSEAREYCQALTEPDPIAAADELALRIHELDQKSG